ncbi:hypothetical protein NS381_11700 [Pantoea stewartii]|nr:hypothetical protein NS381_11700 [Pantoea stewartii]
MPGIVRNRVDTGLESAPEQGFYAVAEWRYMSNIAADDSNTVRAPSYAVTVVNRGYKWLVDAWTQDLVGRVDNLFDYVGSVIVNESNGRYYESVPGRNYSVGLTVPVNAGGCAGAS